MSDFNTSKITENTGEAVDIESKAELNNWSVYDEQSARQENEHGLAFKNVLFNIAKASMYILSALFFTLLIIWFLHQILPLCWLWLDKERAHSLERILFASTLVSVAGKYFSKYNLLDKKNKA